MNEKRKGPVRRLFAALWAFVGWLRVSLANLLFLLFLLLVLAVLSSDRLPTVPADSAMVVLLATYKVLGKRYSPGPRVRVPPPVLPIRPMCAWNFSSSMLPAAMSCRALSLKKSRKGLPTT